MDSHHAGFLKDGSEVTFTMSKKTLTNEAIRRGLNIQGKDRSNIYNELIEATKNGNDGSTFNCDTRNFTQLMQDLPKEKKKDPRKSLLCRLGLVAVPPKPIEDFNDIRIPEKFICALTRKLAVEPVVAVNGMTYEKVVIEKAFQDLPYGFDPITAVTNNKSLSNQQKSSPLSLIEWQKAQVLRPAPYLVLDMSNWLDDKSKTFNGLIPYPSIVDLLPISLDVIGKQPHPYIENRLNIKSYIKSNNPDLKNNNHNNIHNEEEDVSLELDPYSGRGDDTIPTSHLISPIGSSILSEGRKMFTGALQVSGEYVEILALMQVPRYKAPKNGIIMARSLLKAIKHVKGEASFTKDDFDDDSDDDEERVSKGLSKTEKLKSDRHNFVSVDCNLTVKEMDKYGGMAPHLTSVLGRTSDLDHCPGLVLRIHERMEKVVKLGDGAYSTGRSAMQCAELFPSQNSENNNSFINDDSDKFKLDTEILHDGIDILLTNEKKRLQSMSSNSNSNHRHQFHHNIPCMSVHTLLKRHFISIPHRLVIAHHMVLGMLSLKKLSKNKRLHGGLSMKTILKEKFVFEYPTECMYSVFDYWNPWTVHIMNGDPRLLPPELISIILLYMTRNHPCTWEEAMDYEINKLSNNISLGKTMNPHGGYHERKGYYGSIDNIYDSSNNNNDNVDNVLAWTSACDVWSIGLSLWELFSDGLTPYSGVDDEKAAKLICGGDRPFKPDLMSEELYELCLDCWMENPRSRPTLEKISETLDGIVSQGLAEFNMTVASHIRTPFGDNPVNKSTLTAYLDITLKSATKQYKSKQTLTFDDLYLLRPCSSVWDKVTLKCVSNRGAEAILDLLRMYGVRHGLGRESDHAQPSHASYGEVAYRLRDLLSKIQENPEVVIERLLFEYNGAISSLYVIGLHYETDEDIAQSVDLCMKLAWRHKGLSTRSLDIIKKTFTILLLIVSPQLNNFENTNLNGQKNKNKEKENDKDTEMFKSLDSKNNKDINNKEIKKQIHIRACGMRSIIIDKKYNFSKWICLMLRSLMSLQKNHSLPELKILLHIKNLIKNKYGQKFNFQTEKYEKRIIKEKIKLKREMMMENDNENDDEHDLPNEPIVNKMKPEEEDMIKYAELELIQAKIRYGDILCLGSTCLKLQCSSLSLFYEKNKTDVAARAYSHLPEWNYENVKIAEKSQNIYNQHLMSAAAAASSANAILKGIHGSNHHQNNNKFMKLLPITSHIGWFNINYSHSVRDHVNVKPMVKSNISMSSLAKGGEWCTDDARKDKMVFKLEVVEVLTLLLMTSETFLNSELSCIVLEALRNLAQTSGSLQRGKHAYIGETRKHALIGINECDCLKIVPNKEMDGFEVNIFKIYVQVESGGVSIDLLPQLMNKFSSSIKNKYKKKNNKSSPLVLSNALSYIVALCGGIQPSGERIHYLFHKQKVYNLALTTLHLYSAGKATEHLPTPEFVETFVDEEESETGGSKNWLLNIMNNETSPLKDATGGDSGGDVNKVSSEQISKDKVLETHISFEEELALSQACALLRSLSADIGPFHLVEERRQQLMSFGTHLYISSALTKYPTNAKIHVQGLGCLKNLTAGHNSHAEKRRDIMADSGVLNIIAKAASMNFIDNDDDNEDDLNILLKKQKKKNKNKNLNKIDQYATSGIAAGSEALQALKNIYEGADRERSAKEMADAISNSSFTRTLSDVLYSISDEKKNNNNNNSNNNMIESQEQYSMKNKSSSTIRKEAQYHGKPDGIVPVASIPQGRLESIRRVLTPGQFDTLFFNPLEEAKNKKNVRSAKPPREPTSLPPPLSNVNKNLTTLLQDDDENGINNNEERGELRNSGGNKKRFVAPKALPMESTMVLDVANTTVSSSKVGLKVANLALNTTSQVTQSVGGIANEWMTSTPKVMNENYQQVSEVTDEAVESLTSQLKTIFA